MSAVGLAALRLRGRALSLCLCPASFLFGGYLPGAFFAFRGRSPLRLCPQFGRGGFVTGALFSGDAFLLGLSRTRLGLRALALRTFASVTLGTLSRFGCFPLGFRLCLDGLPLALGGRTRGFRLSGGLSFGLTLCLRSRRGGDLGIPFALAPGRLFLTLAFGFRGCGLAGDGLFDRRPKAFGHALARLGEPADEFLPIPVVAEAARQREALG